MPGHPCFGLLSAFLSSTHQIRELIGRLLTQSSYRGFQNRNLGLYFASGFDLPLPSDGVQIAAVADYTWFLAEH